MMYTRLCHANVTIFFYLRCEICLREVRQVMCLTAAYWMGV